MKDIFINLLGVLVPMVVLYLLPEGAPSDAIIESLLYGLSIIFGVPVVTKSYQLYKSSK